jgi:hypothetical protein
MFPGENLFIYLDPGIFCSNNLKVFNPYSSERPNFGLCCFWAGSYECNKFLDFLKLIVKMRLAIRFAGV